MPSSCDDSASPRDFNTREAVVYDVTTSPAYWGSLLGSDEDLIMVQGGRDVADAADQLSATNLIQAHLIEVMSAIGRPYLDYYFFQIRRELTPQQVQGAVSALKSAKEEGHIRSLGIALTDTQPALEFWRANPIFDVALLESSHSEVESFAKVLGVPIVTMHPSDCSTIAEMPPGCRS